MNNSNSSLIDSSIHKKNLAFYPAPSPNTAPTFLPRNVTIDNYNENDAARVIDSAITVFDSDLAGLNNGAGNYGGATLTLERSGGASADDVFSALGNIKLKAGKVYISDSVVASYSNNAGRLSITFNDGTTQSQVNEIASSLTYANTSNTPPSTLQIKWSLNDGNTGLQGAGGTLSGSCYTTVNITVLNDAPSFQIGTENHIQKVQVPTLKSDVLQVLSAFSNPFFSTPSISVNGKYLVSASGNNGLYTPTQNFLIRINNDGSLDTSFNGSGYIADAPGVVHEYNNGDLLVQNGGQLQRLLSNGQLDSSFSTNLPTIPGFGIHRVIAKNNSDIYVVMHTFDTTDMEKIIRLNHSGSITQEFNLPSNSFVFIEDVEVLNNGQIILAGDAGDFMSIKGSLMKLNADGSIDNEFGLNGLAQDTRSRFSSLSDIVITTDGKILATSYSTLESGSQLNLLRFNANGSLDTTFNGTGYSSLNVSGRTDYTKKIQLQEDGSILVTAYTLGSAQYPDRHDIQVIFNSDGSVRSSLDGNVMYTRGAAAVVLDSNVQIVDADVTQSNYSGSKLILERLGGANSEDDFSGNGTLVFQAAQVQLNGVIVGSYTEVNGKLTINFNANATQTALNQVLQNLSYANTSLTADGVITLKWLFNDGTNSDNSIVTGLSYVNIVVPKNTVPTTSNAVLNLNEDSAYALKISDFAFTDVNPSDTLQSVLITSLASNGSLKLNGSAVTVNQVITANDIAAGKLVFTPAANANGNNYANFGFKVSDGIALSNAASVTINVTPINDAPTGIVSIQGVSEKGQTLSVSNTLADVDGLGKISYQWLADGVAISGANSTSITLSRTLVGKKISVQASYTDGSGTLERVQSAQTSAVVDVNSSFRGNVYINGQATQGETLTATHNLNDPDGMGKVTYQWNSNGLAITGANQSTLKLDESLVGKLISVTAAFIDGKGNLESTTYGLHTIVGNNLQGGSANEVFKGTTGHDIINGGVGSDTVQFNGKLADYTIKNVNGKFIVSDKAGKEGIDTLSNIETLKFTDMSMNLTIQGKLPSAPSAAQLKLIELYIAFFNRIPDADGLSYWIDQLNGGMKLDEIAESFYKAGLTYSKETGYSSTMSNADFVNIVYKNTLGRKEGADADGLKYWSEQLATGKATRGSLVNEILNSAHSFKGKADFGWVADLLDNKVTVGKTIAVDWGINFNTPEESISKGMAIAAAVTATDYQAALKLVGINSIDIALTGVAPLETGFALM